MEKKINFYFAPLEGITDDAFRRTHARYYPGIDRYYAPFFSPTIHRQLTPREQRELPVVQSGTPVVVPQVLTKNAEDFLWAAGQCAERGYTEVNLNLGCPSGTVFSKGKGSGMLAHPDALREFLDGIFRDAPIPISVKTRIGVTEADEFPVLVNIFNDYPISLLIVHPRVRKAFYNGPVDMDAFRYAVENCKHPLCYNGDVMNLPQAESISREYPGVESVMVGRGLIAWPGMCTEDRDVGKLMAFHDDLLVQYLSLFGGSRNAMFRMKEHWMYLLPMFRDSEKLGKRLRKTTDLAEFRSITHEIFQTLPYEPK